MEEIIPEKQSFDLSQLLARKSGQPGKPKKTGEVKNMKRNYEVPALELKVVREKGIDIMGENPFTNSGQVFAWIKDYYNGAHAETFITLYLDNQHRVIGCYLQKGTVNQTAIYPREIFARALLCNAVSVIFIHNHPSGSLKPSVEDINISHKLKNGGSLLQITVLDSIIVTDDGYYSFKDSGIF